MFEPLRSIHSNVKLTKDGVRWFGYKVAETRLKEPVDDRRDIMLERFSQEMKNSSINYALVGLNRANFLPFAPSRAGAYLIIFDWGFSKRKVIERVNHVYGQAKSLASLAGLELKERLESPSEDMRLLGYFVSVLADTPKMDGNQRLEEPVKLGTLIAGGDLEVDFQELFKHMVVVGETGSGKSTFVSKLLKRLQELNHHFLVFDWHGEYSGLLGDSSVLVIAPDQDLGFDIFDYPRNVDPFIHIDILMDIFSDSFDLSVSQQFVLRSALRKVFTEKGHGMNTSAKSVSIDDVIKSVSELRTYSGWEQESKLAVLRRVSRLADTGLSRMLNASQKIGFNDLISENVIIDLGLVTDNYSKVFVVEAILKLLYDYKVSKKLTEAHVIVTEEARNIVPFRRPEEPPSTMERVVEELRKFGEAMIAVNQLPSTISQEVLTAAGNLVAFRLKGGMEYEILNKRCNLDKSVCEKLAALPVGHGVCRLSDNMTQLFEI
jgi:hypothetical protein